MATGKTYRSQNYRFLSTDRTSPMISSDSVFELDESDMWNNNNNNRSSSPDYRKSFTNTRFGKKSSSKNKEISDQRSGSISSLSTASSLPVNVPDWSKILRDDYRDNRFRESDGYGEYDNDCFYGGDRENRIPPHEFLAQQMARNRVASFSVHEGIGRTLKGRDLSRVRNAIWEKTGFED